MIIPGFSGYNIEPDGVVTKVGTGEVVKRHTAYVKGNVYARVSLKNDEGITYSYNVLSLLALTFLDKPLDKGIARAKDGNNLNTTLENTMCTDQSSITKQMWQSSRMKDRRVRPASYNDDSVALVYDTMRVYDRPVTMTELSHDLLLPYTTIRYSMIMLREAKKVRKTKEGFEVIK